MLGILIAVSRCMTANSSDTLHHRNESSSVSKDSDSDRIDLKRINKLLDELTLQPICDPFDSTITTSSIQRRPHITSAEHSSFQGASISRASSIVRFPIAKHSLTSGSIVVGYSIESVSLSLTLCSTFFQQCPLSTKIVFNFLVHCCVPCNHISPLFTQSFRCSLLCSMR